MYEMPQVQPRLPEGIFNKIKRLALRREVVTPSSEPEWTEIVIDFPDRVVSLKRTGLVLEGTLNKNYELIDETGSRYLLREPKPDPAIKKYLADWYPKQGFIEPTYRTIWEQFNFMNDAATVGIQVVRPIAIARDGSTLIMPFLEDERFDQYLQRGETELIQNVLDNVLAAHTKGFVFGDRWCTNTLITPEGIKEIDFDILLRGPYAKEFELGKLLYHTVYFAKDRKKVLSTLEEYMAEHRNEISIIYSPTLVESFIRKHAQLFSGAEPVVVNTLTNQVLTPINEADTERLLDLLK